VQPFTLSAAKRYEVSRAKGQVVLGYTHMKLLHGIPY
jgi:hypothetical protein